MMVGWRFLAVVFGLAVLAAGCSSDGDGVDESLGDPDAPATVVDEPSTTTTSTTIATTATLSELAQAEAEIEEVITAYWTKTDDPDRGLEHLTGLIARRIEERRVAAADEGFIRVGRGTAVIDVTSIEVDLDKGEASVNSCGGTDVIRLDAETREPINEGDDPSYQTTSRWVMQLTADGWKIAEWFPSFNTGSPVECTVDDQ